MSEIKFELTESQKELEVKMKAFMQSDSKTFRIIGKPGVGKTTITKIVLKELIDYEKRRLSGEESGAMQLAGIALSHQAKNVLGEHIPNVFTFAKAYGLKEVYNESTGERSFERDIHNKDIIPGKLGLRAFVHDEVSQYTPDMLQIVLDNTDMFSKIIMIGDKAQLPPIDSKGAMKKDEDSPVFSLKLTEGEQHELTQRVRQAEGNPILELTDVIREEIFGNQDLNRIKSLIRETNLDEGVGYGNINKTELLPMLNKEHILKTSVLGYRNKKSIEPLNDKIRNHLLDTPFNDIIPGDLVRMKENYYVTRNGDTFCAFHNSQVLEIEEVKTFKSRITVHSHAFKIDCFSAKVKGKDIPFVTPTRNGYLDLQDILKQVASYCKQRIIPWSDFWDIKKMYCDYNYAYASTIYKAQGSTYDRVFIDVNDIFGVYALTNKRKLQALYTAITRAKYDAYFIL